MPQNTYVGGISSQTSGGSWRPARQAWYCVVRPDHWMLARWDICSAALLCLVCVLTPLEAGFLPCAETWGVRWFINLVVTFFFFCDLVLQFFLPFTEHTKAGNRIQRRKPAIVKNYVTTWFALDFVSVFPFGLLFPCTPGKNAGVDLGVVRAVRLLRLLKLLRLLRGLRLLTRWQTEFGFSLRKTVLYTIMVAVIVATHWMACALGLISRFQGQACSPAQTADYGESDGPRGCAVTWLSAAAAARHDQSLDGSDPPDEISFTVAYLIAVHASMSILVHPHTYHPTGLVEQGSFVFLLLVGGFVWTQVISRTTAIRTSLSKHENEHQTTMDDLNSTMTSLSLTQTLRRRQRKFFLYTRDVVKYQTWQGIVNRMSPKLNRDLNREMNKAWVMNIQFLAQCPLSIISDVSQKLSLCAFSESEIFGEMWHLYIVKIGSVMLHSGKVVPANGVWGEDHLLLSCGDLVADNMATALIFVQCHTLSRPAFQEIIYNHPDYYSYFRRKTVKMAVVRGIRLQAEILKKQMRLEARSLAGKSTRSELDEAAEEALCFVRNRQASTKMDWIQPPTPSPTVMPSMSNLTAVTEGSCASEGATAPESTPEREPAGSLRGFARGSAEAIPPDVPRPATDGHGRSAALSPVPVATLEMLSRTVDRVAEEQRALEVFVDQQLTMMEQKIRVLTANAAQAPECAPPLESGELLSAESRGRDADAVYF